MFACGAIQDLLFMAPLLEHANLMELGMASKHFVKVRVSSMTSFLETC